MAPNRKVNATGRSTGKYSGRDKKAFEPRTPFIWHALDMRESPAWRARSINCVRLLDRLEIEHLHHGGVENGKLVVTYDDFVKHGISRGEIHRAIDEAIFLGLLRVERGGRWAGTNQPSCYRLTYFATWDCVAPTNEWMRRTSEQISAWRKERAARENAARRWKKKQKTG